MDNNTKSGLIITVIMAVLLSGCLASAEFVVTDSSGEASFDLSKGVVYDIDVIA